MGPDRILVNKLQKPERWDIIEFRYPRDPQLKYVDRLVGLPGETVFIEPAGVAHLSAERAVLKGEEDREIRRILRRLSGEVARVAKPLTVALDAMAKLDFITARARFSRDYRMAAPDLNADGRLWLGEQRRRGGEPSEPKRAETAERSGDRGSWCRAR